MKEHVDMPPEVEFLSPTFGGSSYFIRLFIVSAFFSVCLFTPADQAVPGHFRGFPDSGQIQKRRNYVG